MTRTVGRAALMMALLVAVVLLGFLAIGPRLLPYRTVTMLTGSMRPTIPPGAVAVVVAEPVSQLRAGQVVTFHAPVAGRPVVTHRVVSVDRRDGRVLIRTRGDANSGNDPWLAEVHGGTVWRLRAVVPHLGSALRLLRTGALHFWVVWALPLIALVWFLIGVWRPRAVAGSESREGGDELPCAYPDEPSLPVRSSSPMRSSASRRPARLRSHRPARRPQPGYPRRRQPSSHRSR